MPAPDHRGRRKDMQVRVFRLGDEPRDDLSEITTPEERLEIVAELSRRMWALTGKPEPVYSRSDMPVRVMRPT